MASRASGWPVLAWCLATELLAGVLFIGIYPAPVFEAADAAVEAALPGRRRPRRRPNPARPVGA
ncbi:MAG: hypothetical protein U5Q44_11790 [Dehalococcoidia bacterium]|nr:hypothetical protein [Dehalococcoidia bacterium]